MNQKRKRGESGHCHGFEKLSLEAASIVSTPKRILMLPCPGRGSDVQEAKRASGAYMLFLTQHSYYFILLLSGCNTAKEGMHKVSAPVSSHFYFTVPLLQASVMDDVVGWCVD